jgi:DNA-binding transcriptional ArsR family regulator
MEESYPREIARILQRPVSGVRKALASLEKDGLVAGRIRGRVRLVRLSPRYFAQRELKDYLGRLTEPETELRTRIARLRLRPRNVGKRL